MSTDHTPDLQRKLFGCATCRREPEPGYIEMENNGPIVPCWSCNFEEWKRANTSLRSLKRRETPHA